MDDEAEQHTPLEWADTADLWDELKSRYDTALFIGSTDVTRDGSSVLDLWFTGLFSHLAGLCVYGQDRFLRAIRKASDAPRGSPDDERLPNDL